MKYFTMHEFLRSGTAQRLNIDMTPTRTVEVNLRRLVTEVLDPIRAVIGHPIVITSGYRPPALNEQIGGSKKSFHLRGLAADFVVPNMDLSEVMAHIHALELPALDKVILEFGQWIHVQIQPQDKAPRNEYLLALKNNGRTEYRHWS